jgi:hypothetical protein
MAIMGAHPGRGFPGRSNDLGPAAVQPVDTDVFWRLFAKFVMRLVRDRIHGEVTLVFQDGHLKLVKVHRNYLPGSLPSE